MDLICLGNYQKYDPKRRNNFTDLLTTKCFVPKDFTDVNFLCDKMQNLIITSTADSTWRKHNAALSALQTFLNINRSSISWPLHLNVIRSFAVYCLTQKNLKASTTRAYITSISLAHKLKNCECSDFLKDTIVKLILSGGEKQQMLGSVPVSTRRPMNIPTLLTLGHRISLLNWNTFSQQVVWTACTTAFFTSARMGELLPQFSSTYDTHCTLLWKHVKFVDRNEILLHFPYTKTKGLYGADIYVFKYIDFPCCPVEALLLLKDLAVKKGLYDPEAPVFRFENGKFLTNAKLNEILRTLLQDIFDKNIDSISCHSFRAAIPSAIAAFPDKMFVSEVKEWGGWNSDAYKTYCKLEKSKRKVLHDKIVTVISADMYTVS